MKKDFSNNEPLLWSKFLSGDDEAYSIIYKEYVQALFRYGLQFTSDRELVKDCIQDVFEKIHKNRSKLKQTDNVKLYLFVILKNGLLNVLRRESYYVYNLEADGFDEFSTGSENTVENQIISQEEENAMKEKMRLIFSFLTPRQKEVIYYRFVESMSISDIAILMEMNYQSTQNLIQRSIKKIRKDLNEY